MGLTKAQLEALNDSSFPNNNAGYITPTILRDYNDAVINNTVNQDVYTTDSASFNSRINASTGSVTSAITASSLVTASFNNGTRDLTFTKGDSSTFSVNIPDVSGSSGNFVTTSSFNDYTQSVANTIATLATTASVSTLSASIAVTDDTQTNLINGKLDTSSFTTFSQSVDSRLDSLEGAGYVTSTITGSSLVTASLSGNTITFTKGDSSTFGFTIPDVSGSTIDTGSFATTGSNSFNGNQIITGSVTISGSSTSDLTVVGQIFVSSSATGNTTQPRITVSGSQGQSIINRSGISTRNLTYSAQLNPAGVFMSNVTTLDELGFGVDSGSFSNWTFGPGIYVNNPSDTYPAVFGFQNKANYTDGRVAVLTPLSASAGFTASLQNGYAWVGNSLGENTQVATSSFGTTINTGSFATTGSNTFTGQQTINEGASSNLQMTATSQNNIGLTAPNNFISTTGNFSFNNNGNGGGSGSLSFTATSNSINLASDNGVGIGRTSAGGPASNGIVKMNTSSGSLLLTPTGFSSNASDLLHLSSSSENNFVNLIFKNNNNTTSTTISGSNNLFVNASAPTAGFRRYIGGSGNIALNAGNIPQITGSMTFNPIMNNNYFGAAGGGVVIRGPITSTGTYNINSNSILGAVNIGASTANHAEKLQTLNLNNNQIAGTLNIIANKELLAGTLGFSNNNLNGGLTLTLASASVQMANCNINDSGFNIINNSFTTAAGTGSLALNRLNIGGSGNTINAVGSGSAASFSDNVIFGQSNTLQIDLSQTNNSLNANNILGRNLIATGSGVFTDGSTIGSLFTGRNNAIDGNKALTAQTVFAVGTGTATVRKTGFLIDSGSNTFVEGTLNVSGSTSLTGSLIQSSSNSIFAGPGGAGVGTHIQNRVLISGPDTGETPRLYISGSDSGYSEYGRGFQTLDTTKTSGLGAFIYTAGHVSAINNNTVAAASPDFSTDVEIQMFAGTGSIGLADWDNVTTFSYVPFMTVAPNNGNNPSPVFTRGLKIASGSQLTLPTGSNQQVGTATLDGGNPGTVTVSNSLVNANSIIMLTKQTLSNSHMVAVSSKGSGTFTITSTGNGDADVVGWMIINNS